MGRRRQNKIMEHIVRSSDQLARILGNETRGEECREAVVCVLRDDEMTFTARGDWNSMPVSIDTPFLIASTSKIFVTAMILRLVTDGKITLADRVNGFFGDELKGLHTWRGRDLTGEITIRQLLCHNSGLADYFEGRRRDGTSLAERLFSGEDFAYGLGDVVAWVRDEMSPAFEPGAVGRALYSDTNFFLLSEIITRVCHKSLNEVLQEYISSPVGLKQTCFFHCGDDTLPLRLGNMVLNIPKALSSMPGDGGVISTARELALFARAFFGGLLFAESLLSESNDWRRLFFPLEAGLGVLRFRLPWFLPPFRADMSFVGHSGISGAFVYYWPPEDLIISGTVNQIMKRNRSYRVLVKSALVSRRSRMNP